MVGATEETKRKNAAPPERMANGTRGDIVKELRKIPGSETRSRGQLGVLRNGQAGFVLVIVMLIIVTLTLIGLAAGRRHRRGHRHHPELQRPRLLVLFLA